MPRLTSGHFVARWMIVATLSAFALSSAVGCSSRQNPFHSDARSAPSDQWLSEVMHKEHEWPPNCKETASPSPWTILESGTDEDLWTVAGTSSTNVIAAGANTFLHYDGVTWKPVGDYGSRFFVRDLWPAGEEIFAVGDSGLILRQTGTVWQESRLDEISMLWRIWGSDSKNIWVISYQGWMFHYDGSSWQSMSSPLSRAGDIHGSGPSDILVTSPWDATKTDIYHFNGTAWNPAVTLPRGLGNLWVSPTGEAIFVGAQDGTVTHFFRGQWTTKDAGTTNQLYAVWGVSATDVYAAGKNGVITHYDGVAWQQVPSPTRFGLWGISSTPDGVVFIVGECGKIISRRIL